MIIFIVVINKFNKVVMMELVEEVDFSKLFMVFLEIFFVKNFDGNRERFEVKVEIVINVFFVDSVEVVFFEDVVGVEVFGDGFEFEESEGDDGRRSVRVGSRGIV